MIKVILKNEEKAQKYEETKKVNVIAQVILEDGTVELFFLPKPKKTFA